MPIDEGVNIDLQFLILEVKKQAKASLSVIEKPSEAKVRRIRAREDYVNNLKNTLVNKSYFNIHANVQDDRQMNYFKALITIASNLERCSDFFENIARQMLHVQDPTSFADLGIRRFYRVVYRALDKTYPALTQHDLNLAQEICDHEQTLDDYYDEAFEKIRQELRRRRNVDDLLTALNVVRYLERAGDSFLNIGEAVLDIHVGEKMGIRQFRQLRKGLDSVGIDIQSELVEFKPIMNTRSGSRVAKVLAKEQKTVFYKEGPRAKIDEEVKGLELWQKKVPGMTPRILWHNKSSKNHATILLEYIEGDDFLELLLQHPSKLDAALGLLLKTQTRIWRTGKRSKAEKVDVISQLLKRRDDIQSVHQNLFDLDEDIDTLFEEAKKLEKTLRAPFTTLTHGDFNVDNIIFSPQTDALYYVDVHRSGYGDYTQDVAVFLVSNFRIPIFSSDIRQRLNEANIKMLSNARRFASRNKDSMFEARLALGLFRSLITSTRFLFDKNFSADMFHRALLLLRELLAAKDNLQKFKVKEPYYTYGSGNSGSSKEDDKIETARQPLPEQSPN